MARKRKRKNSNQENRRAKEREDDIEREIEGFKRMKLDEKTPMRGEKKGLVEDTGTLRELPVLESLRETMTFRKLKKGDFVELDTHMILRIDRVIQCSQEGRSILRGSPYRGIGFFHPLLPRAYNEIGECVEIRQASESDHGEQALIDVDMKCAVQIWEVVMTNAILVFKPEERLSPLQPDNGRDDDGWSLIGNDQLACLWKVTRVCYGKGKNQQVKELVVLRARLGAFSESKLLRKWCRLTYP